MKKILYAAALSLPLAMTNALADEGVTDELIGTPALVELSDQELDQVQGGFFSFCAACFAQNTAIVTQLNLSVASFGTRQSNNSFIAQNNN